MRRPLKAQIRCDWLYGEDILPEEVFLSSFARGSQILKVVPFSGVVAKETFPPKYCSPKSFILYVPRPRFDPFVENER